MGRKKKVTQKKKQEAQIVGNQPVNYAGHVTVTLQRGNKTISSKVYHNKGRGPLFKFLCSCLGGYYFDQSKPCKIKLFNYTSGTSVSPSNFNWENDLTWEDITEVSSYITFDASPVIKNSEDVDYPEQYQITYHFRLPDAYIAGAQVNVIGIYGNNAVDPKEDAMAYYKLVDAEGNWDPLDFSNTSGNFTVVIDWTMTIRNA